MRDVQALARGRAGAWSQQTGLQVGARAPWMRPHRAVGLLTTLIALACACVPAGGGAAAAGAGGAAAGVSVWWLAPFFSGGGYGSEALALFQGLELARESRGGGVNRLKVTQHGDGTAQKHAGREAKPRSCEARASDCAAARCGTLRGRQAVGCVAYGHQVPTGWLRGGGCTLAALQSGRESISPSLPAWLRAVLVAPGSSFRLVAPFGQVKLAL